MSTASESLQKAFALHRAGQLDEAERIAHQLASDDPHNAQAWHLLGVAAHQRGQLDRAVEHFCRAIELDPGQFLFHVNLATVYSALKRTDEAIASLREAVQLKPNDAMTHNDLGVLFAAQGCFDEAAACFRTVLALQPDFAPAHNNLGNILNYQGRPEEAIECFRAAVRAQPKLAQAYNNLANTLKGVGQFDAAIDQFREALRIAPDYVEARFSLGNLLKSQGRLPAAREAFEIAIDQHPDMAEAHYELARGLVGEGDADRAAGEFETAIRLKPGFFDAHMGLAELRRSQGRYDAAITAYQAALRCKENSLEALTNLGLAFFAQDEFGAAIEAFRRVLALEPRLAAAHYNLASAQKASGDLAGAERSLRELLAIDPNHAEAHFHHAMLRLARGDFAAWSEYEWRWKLPGAGRQPASAPDWNGEPLAGRTIMLYAEQGLGDSLQFIRYAPLVKARGGRVVVACPKRLIPILSSCAGIDELYGEGDAPVRFDTHASLVSLARIFHTDLDSIPADVPYLSARGELVEGWREKLPVDGLRVGISWQGNPNHVGDSRRSIRLAEFAPLAHVKGVRLVSLQKGFGVEQLTNAPFKVYDLGSRLDEGEAAFCDTAAVIENLDLVITSDTSVAHLAGALAVPVWVALSRVADWRWLLDRRDSPWYPTMRLFRQQSHGRWSDVFQSMADGLRELVASGVSRPKPTRLNPSHGES